MANIKYCTQYHNVIQLFTYFLFDYLAKFKATDLLSNRFQINENYSFFYLVTMFSQKLHVSIQTTDIYQFIIE